MGDNTTRAEKPDSLKIFKRLLKTQKSNTCNCTLFYFNLGFFIIRLCCTLILSHFNYFVVMIITHIYLFLFCKQLALTSFSLYIFSQL